MILDFYNSKSLQYTTYLVLFIVAQSFSMVGQYISLPYKNLTYYQSLTMCLPFAWINWFIMTFAIDIGHTYKLVSPTQNIFLLIILQFILILIINQVYLKQKIYKSDIVAFIILLVGYFISFFHLFSKLFNFVIPPHIDKVNISILSKNPINNEKKELDDEKKELDNEKNNTIKIKK